VRTSKIFIFSLKDYRVNGISKDLGTFFRPSGEGEIPKYNFLAKKNQNSQFELFDYATFQSEFSHFKITKLKLSVICL
jgi:hypothetical protein